MPKPPVTPQGVKIRFRQPDYRAQDQLKFLAELAFVHSLKQCLPRMTEKSRKHGLMGQLLKVVEHDINTKTMRATQKEIDWMQKQLDAFGRATKWAHVEKDLCTLTSFCCALVQRDEKFSPVILEKLNLLQEHMEEAGHARISTSWAGSMALKKWDKLFSQRPV